MLTLQQKNHGRLRLLLVKPATPSPATRLYRRILQLAQWFCNTIHHDIDSMREVKLLAGRKSSAAKLSQRLCCPLITSAKLANEESSYLPAEELVRQSHHQRCCGALENPPSRQISSPGAGRRAIKCNKTTPGLSACQVAR